MQDAYCKINVIQEKNFIKSDTVQRQVGHWFQGQVPQSRQVRYTPQFFLPSWSIDPSCIGGRLCNLINVSGLAKDDSSLNPQSLQILVQQSQSSFGIVPAATLIDRDIDILRANMLREFQDSFVPEVQQLCFIIPVCASYENLRGSP